MSVVNASDKRLAEAVALFVEAIHQAFPAVVTRPIPPYDDEDFTLEVRIPAEMDRDCGAERLPAAGAVTLTALWLCDPPAGQGGVTRGVHPRLLNSQPCR